ncbi:MAG: cation:proton antiporter [Candidatus Jorgensenbacteria bacterium]|nr:cation:proton antiporter [Candidatus Jorgensenbacteria bacterium]
MASGIFELAVIILIASVLGVIAKLLRQPIILAYLLTGIVIGSLGALNLVNNEVFSVFSNLGIMFLLFLVGLEINYAALRLVGKTSIIVGLGQIIFTAAIGYLIAVAFGFSMVPALYIAIALTFSSTVIVVKLLSDKKDLNSLYGKIAVGFLLVQDFVAAILLIFLAGLASGGGHLAVQAFATIGKGVGLLIIMLLLGRKILPRIFGYVAHSQELLFLISLAWLFLVAAGAYWIGFSVEIAGFLAGLALANSSEHFQIASRVKPLRDFFLLIFFVILGSSIVLSNFGGLTIPVIVFSLFVLIGNPIIVLVLMGAMGYRRRTSFFAGVTVAQISEFSLVLAALGLKIGHISENVVALITMVGIITIALSTYLITHSDAIFKHIHPLLRIFERKKTSEFSVPEEEFHKPIILIGCHRTGESIAMSLPKKGLLIVDFDPDVIRAMSERGYECLFGDIEDAEIFEKANTKDANLIISTSPDLENNLTLLSELSRRKGRPKTIIRAETEEDARTLYKAGADYVLLPHFTSGQYLGKTIAIDPDMKILRQLKEHDLALFRKMTK